MPEAENMDNVLLPMENISQQVLPATIENEGSNFFTKTKIQEISTELLTPSP